MRRTRVHPVFVLPREAPGGKAVANSARPAGEPAANEERDTDQQCAEEHRVPGMPLPAEIRLIGDQSQDGDDRARCDDEPVFPAQAAREYDGRQAPDQHPGGPVERPREFGVVRRAAPPLPEHVHRRKLEVDRQVDAEPEERFDNRIPFVEISEAMAGAYRGHGYQAGCVERRDDHMLRRMGRGPVAWQPDDEDHRGEKCIGKPEAMPYPERNDGAGGGNQESGSVRRANKVTAEESACIPAQRKPTEQAARASSIP